MHALSRPVYKFFLAFTLLAVLLASCSMPNTLTGATPQGQPESAATPTAPAPQTYTPAIIETVPLAGSRIGVQEAITFYFNQPMDRASVETAWIADPVGGGEFLWADDATLTFKPSQPLQAGASLKMGVNTGARAASGVAFTGEESFTYSVADALHPRQFLPEDGSVDISVDAAVVVSFDQPVVTLGADPATLPAAFALDPSVGGRGTWLNTSTYMFTPEPALAGGTTYRVNLDAALTSNAGTSLMQANGAPLGWSFTTAKPRLLEISPSTETPLPLDLELTLTFNQPMERANVEANFALADANANLPGSFAWTDDLRSVTFTPNERLARNTSYWLRLAGTTQALGGTPLDVDWNVEMISAPNFYVISTTPEAGGQTTEYGGASISFTNTIASENIDNFVSISPSVPNFNFSAYENQLQAYGSFAPNTDYTLQVSGDIQDIWGETLGDTYLLRFRTPSAQPRLSFPYLGSNLYFTPAENASFYMQATNVPSADVTFGAVPLNDLFRLFSANGYTEREAYQPEMPDAWVQKMNTLSNKSETIVLPLTDPGTTLTPGVYSLRIWQAGAEGGDGPVFIVASHANLVFKLSATDALVWATDVRSGMPFVDETVSIFDETGTLLNSGKTDVNGVWRGEIPAQADTYQTYYAQIGEPGTENFGLGTSLWGDDISPWRFNLSVDDRPPHTEVYFYTDRPIYRPGQTVYFRAVVREAYDGRYAASTLTSLPLTLANDWGENLQSFNPSLSAFGTANGSFTLPEDARPGYYSFFNQDLQFSANFQVAEYRKPEINLDLSLEPNALKSGAPLSAALSARYYFDAPASDLPVQWYLYGETGYFSLPGYAVGDVNLNWMRGYYDELGYFGELLDSGEGKTNGDGTLSFDISGLDLVHETRSLTLEIVAQDESGQQISTRQSIQMHPEDYYIGIHTEQWVGREATEMGFDVLSVDWNGDPLPDLNLHADFQQVTWQRQDSANNYEPPTFIPTYSPVSDVDFVTGGDGAARLSFTPPSPGTYILDVSGGRASTQILLWVTGAERAAMPDLPKQHIRLTADRDSYRPGDTAQIFIPNPIEAPTYALITVERGSIHRAEIIAVEPSGATYSLPLTSEDAPGVFFSAVLLGGQEYRVGYTALDVTPVDQILKVSLTSQPTRSEPGGEVTFGIQVNDAQGAPVLGEFSLAVVDQAALDLANPNSEPIGSAFYGAARIGVHTTLSYAADSIYGVFLDGAGGRGGGGGDGIIVIRDNFPDTAYWNATIATDASGHAQVTMTLPDNLTTWHIDVRGLSNDTRVGSAEMDVVSSKDVLIRPVTPRFMVVGDHVEMAAIVHNNTAQDLTGKVSLQAIGFLLDDPNAIEQEVTVPAGGRTKVSWWGSAQDAETAELIFNSTFGEYQDMTRPTWGSLPILRYTAPQSFVTAGTLEAAGTLTENISLPRSFIPNGGKLDVELAPSLAAAILDGLEAIPAPAESASTEAILSYLLPNVEMLQAMQAAGLSDPELQTRLENSLQDGVRRLLERQTEKYGWGWYATTASQSHGFGVSAMPKLGGGGVAEDDYLSAYVLYGLWRANQTGVYIDETVFANAREYLHIASLPYLSEANPQTWQKDRLAFIQYVMQMTGGADAVAVDQLALWQDGLSPWAQALLALTLDSRTPGDARAQSLLTNLETSARRSASGAHWESDASQWRNPGTPNYTTATVIYALAQFDPATPLVQDATRYLVSHRNVHGYWSSTYENAWSLLALTQVAKSGSELNASYNYNARLNGTTLAEGQASPLTPMVASAPLSGLQLSLPNVLEISRTEGVGRLYYRAALFVDRAAESAPALNQGIEVSRTYYDAHCESDCQPINGIQLMTGAQIKVQLTVTLSEDSYYLMVDDIIPAGTEILNQQLLTSQQGVDATEIQVYDPNDPFAKGWGWWYFRTPEIGDENIQWSADYLPAGTYVLNYTLIPLQAGEYRVLPAHAWQNFFPEVQGTSAGEIFVIR